MAQSPADINDVKATTQRIADKAKSDAAFADRLKADPIATLQAEGMPDVAIAESLKRWGIEPEVSGYEQADVCVYSTQYVESYWNCSYFTT